MAEIGATLREARMRARIDISEIEAQTKIRAKYLRALENEEWDLLPGPTYVKSFLRTYADALGLDGKRLVEEYKLQHERLSDVELQPIAPPGQRRAAGGQRASVWRRVWVGVVVVGVRVGVRAQKALDVRGTRQQVPLLVLQGTQVLGPDLRLGLDLRDVGAGAHARLPQRCADLGPGGEAPRRPARRRARCVARRHSRAARR
jgi:hypothetical protein